MWRVELRNPSVFVCDEATFPFRAGKTRFYDCNASLRLYTDEMGKYITVERGQVVSSYEKIGGTLNMSIQEVRTAVSHLKSTGTLTTRTYRRFQVFTIVNYDYYQSIQTPTSTPYQQAANTLSTPYQQQYNNIKNNKNEKNIYAPSSKENLLFEFLEGDDEI